MTEDGDDHRRFWSRSAPLRALTEEERDAALSHLKDRAVGRMAAHHLALEMQAGQERVHHGDSDAARHYLELVRALRQGGRITYAEYVLQVGSRMEMVSDHRWFQGDYTADLQPISDAMDRITQSHGLSREEYWPRGEEPEDYRVLSDAYSACLNARLIETMREFGEEDLADLREREPARYDALREEGRRSVFEKDNRPTALTTLIDYYEHEAEAAGNAGAYLAGCLMWGAAAEGRLLLWCLRAPALAEQARQALPSKSRPKNRTRRTGPWTVLCRWRTAQGGSVSWKTMTSSLSLRVCFKTCVSREISFIPADRSSSNRICGGTRPLLMMRRPPMLSSG